MAGGLQAIPDGAARAFPLPGGDPGPDCSQSSEADEIRQARQGDDSTLPQGAWTREARPPRWGVVRDRSAALLSRSRCLQAACWHAEALTALEGFPGATRGLRLLAALLEGAGDPCHPLGDPEAKAARLIWLDGRMAALLREAPLVPDGPSRAPFEEALARSGAPASVDAGDPEGRPGMDDLRRTLAARPRSALGEAATRLEEALGALEALRGAASALLGDEAPGLEAVGGMLEACLALVRQALGAQAPTPPVGAGDDPAPAPPPGAPSSPDADPLPGPAPTGAPDGAPGLGPGPGPDLGPHPGPDEEPGLAPLLAGPALARASGTSRPLPGDRREAVGRLTEAARWFRAHEPHSPVAPLVEKAVRWADLPFEAWLRSVVRDEGTLRALGELLDLEGGRP